MEHNFSFSENELAQLTKAQEKDHEPTLLMTVYRCYLSTGTVAGTMQMIKKEIVCKQNLFLLIYKICKSYI